MRRKRKRGRPPNYYPDREGKPIVGLSCDKNGFYNTHYRSEGVDREHFGTPDEYVKAVINFRKWQAKKDRKKRKITVAEERNKQEFLNQIYQRILHNKDGYAAFEAARKGEQYVDPEVVFDLNEGLMWEIARDLIASNSPSVVADNLGIPEFAELHKLKPIPPSLTLKQVGDIYLHRQKKPLKKQEFNDTQRWWEQFCKLTRAKTIRDIALKEIRRYQDGLYKTYNKNNYKPTWLKHRFDKVKTVLNYALKSDQVEYTQDIFNVLTLCRKFVYPDKVKPDPCPIEKEDYLKIFNQANTKQQAIFLLAANAALYPQDCCDVLKKHINLKDGTLVMDRGKTGIPRVATLWSRTVSAIKKMQTEKENLSDHLFITYAGKPYSAHSIGSIWRKLRKEAGVDHSVKFEHIRDAAQTAAAESHCSIDEIRFLMGHRVTNVTDNYLKRRPTLTKKACKAIERYFFGKKP